MKDASGAVDYNRFVFAADYASGKNFIGGGGGGFYIFFTKNISLLVGPTSSMIRHQWKVEIQHTTGHQSAENIWKTEVSKDGSGSPDILSLNLPDTQFGDR